MNYLYHYTSLESLALILKHKTLRFSNLLNVDDTEEAKTNDMGDFGKYLYVSCWTDLERESIPFWSLYTPKMHGVRIRMRTYPFKCYHYKKGEYRFEEDTDTHIDFKQLWNENDARITADQPKLTKVNYSDEDDDLFPTVKKESVPGIAKMFANNKPISTQNATFAYSFEKLGKWKRKDWEFQSEWRYTISLAPMGLHEDTPENTDINRELIRRLEDPETKPPYQYITLELADDALDNIEIVYGPRMSEAEKILADSLISQYAPKAISRNSRLTIR